MGIGRKAAEKQVRPGKLVSSQKPPAKKILIPWFCFHCSPKKSGHTLRAVGSAAQKGLSLRQKKSTP